MYHRQLNSLEYLCSQNYDFVISYTLKKSTREFKNLVLDTSGWITTSIDEETGEILAKEKEVEHTIEYKTPITEEATTQTQKKRGRPRKYEVHTVPVKIHLTWSAKRASKDRIDRENMLEKLEKKLDKPYQLKASVKRGVNQYLEMELETENWKIDEAKVKEAEKYDGYYAIITNNLTLTAGQATEIYSGLWKIEESFRIIKTDLKATPTYVWADKHIQGYFSLCFLSLTIMRYLQFKIAEKTGEQISAAVIMESIEQPRVVLQGEFPQTVVTPIEINQTYLDIMKVLDMKELRKNMTLTQFRSTTKLDLLKNIN